jgi:hypothetical protein
LRVVAWNRSTSLKLSSGSVSRVRVVAANSNGGNRHDAAHSCGADRVGQMELHDLLAVDQTRRGPVKDQIGSSGTPQADASAHMTKYGLVNSAGFGQTGTI